jgi:3-oxoacyl-[acyl-carrier-protein] synthase-3
LQMLNIIDVAVALPGREEPIEDAAARLGLTATELKMFKRYYGFDRFRLDDSQPLGDLLAAAVTPLIARHPNIRRHLEILVHCHTLSDIAPFGHDALSAVRDIVGSTEMMSTTMNHCATGLSMFVFMDAFLSPDGLGVLLVGEKAFHRTIRLIEDTSIMGEAVAAVLVGRRPGMLQYLGGHTTHKGGFSVITGRPSGGSLVGFGPLYYDIMVDHIRQALSEHNMTMDDVRYIFPHNVNAASWRRIAVAVPIPLEKIYMRNIGRYGHCFGADPFVSVVDAAEQGLLDIGDTVLLISAGLGGTVSTALMAVSSLQAECAGASTSGGEVISTAVEPIPSFGV